jgi:hypothetical protein
LALPPDSSDQFLREVEENYRRDQLEGFAKRYGRWIALAIGLFLIATGGWLYWQNRQQEKRAEQSEVLNQIFADVAQGRSATVDQRLAALADEGSGAMRGAALLTRAAVALEQNNRTQALASLRQLADSSGVPDAYRNTALVRLTALEFDTLQPAQVIERLGPLAEAGQPWFGSAGELVAFAHLKANRRTEAGRLFASIAADPTVPGTLRSRAVQIAGTLGVDASASLPALQQQQDTNR